MGTSVRRGQARGQADSSSATSKPQARGQADSSNATPKPQRPQQLASPTPAMERTVSVPLAKFPWVWWVMADLGCHDGAPGPESLQTQDHCHHFNRQVKRNNLK